MEATIISLLVISIIPLEGLVMAIVPWLQRRRECFAVTVPPTAQRDPRLVGLKKRYTVIMVAITVLATALAVALMPGVSSHMAKADELRFLVVFTAASLLIPLISFALMLAFRGKVQEIKWEEGWKAEASRTAAAVVEGDVPQILSLKWNLLYIPIIAITLLMGVAGYNLIPDMVPMHMSLNGEVDNYATKGPGVVAFPVVLELFLALCFTFCHWSIGRSKRPVDPSAPATSALAYAMFARAQSVYLVVFGLLLSLVMGVLFMLSSMAIVSLTFATIGIVAVALVMVIVALGMMLVYGQAGSRVFQRMTGENSMPADDDEHWKLGILYVNPDDPSVFLPERFGVGWTVNLARPLTWVIIIGGAVIIALFVVAVGLLVG